MPQLLNIAHVTKSKERHPVQCTSRSGCRSTKYCMACRIRSSGPAKNDWHATGALPEAIQRANFNFDSGGNRRAKAELVHVGKYTYIGFHVPEPQVPKVRNVPALHNIIDHL